MKFVISNRKLWFKAQWKHVLIRPYNSRLKVAEGDKITRGQVLTEGSIDPKELLKVTDLTTVQEYLLHEVQKVYRMQGVEIGDKHVEVMVRQMLRKVRVIDAGDTDVLPGTLLDIHQFTEANKKVLLEGNRPATGRPVLLGITKASLETDSFLSAASFHKQHVSLQMQRSKVSVTSFSA
nr:hypothetical protein P5664_00370 [Bacillus subtilis]